MIADVIKLIIAGAPHTGTTFKLSEKDIETINNKLGKQVVI